MKAKLRLAALVAGLAIVASACAAGASPTPAATAAPTVAPTVAPATYPTGDIKITLWTKEGEGDGALQFVKKLTQEYEALHPNVKFGVTNKDVEALRQDFLTSSLAGNAPELLWTVADHIGPFTAADTILPLDGLIDPATYLSNALAAVQADGKTWGAPISYGNQLMLYWNEDLVPTAPADSDAMIAAAKAFTDEAAGKYGLVFNQTESFWLVPFLGGYNGSVFAADGKTPTLDTPAMVSALTFMSNLKFTDKVMPKEADYNVADNLFKQGNAAMIVNGDWTLGAYADVFKDKLGVGPIPKITGADFPKPYTAGAFFMVSKAVGDDADKQFVIADFIKFATGKDAQVEMVKTLKRLPGNLEALKDPIVTGDAYLAGAADAITHGVAQPTNLEMRCVFDSMTAGVRNLFGKQADPVTVATDMQASAAKGVAPGGECASE